MRTSGPAGRLADDVVDGFRGHAGRYGLAVFAVSVGIMALTLLVLLVSGLQKRVRDITADFGANVVSVVREDPLSGSVQGLSIRHLALIEANFPGAVATPVRFYKARPLDSTNPITVIATDGGLAAIRDWVLLDGRNLDARDVAENARVLLASRILAEGEGWRTGRIVFLDEQPFFVAGVIDAPPVGAAGKLAGNRASIGERFALIPWSTAPAWRSEQGAVGRRVEQILVRDGSDAEKLLSSLRRLLGQDGVGAGNVSWVTARRLVADIESLKKALTLSIGAIALLCLLLGGTTLMSLMVLNVRERVPEIGLRLSLGARRAQISRLFVIEAVFVTLAAGVAGTLAAHGLAGLVGERLGVTLEPGWLSVLAPTATGVLIGAAFSWWPARMAARITPAEAIRAD